MKAFFFFLPAFLLSSCSSKISPVEKPVEQLPSHQPKKENPFGVMVAKSEEKIPSLEKSIEVAKILGVQYMRKAIIIKSWNGYNKTFEAVSAAGLGMVLNVNYGEPNLEGPVPFPTNLDEYRTKLREILTKYRPALLVIENEEDNKLYHTGSPDDYIAELKAATEVAHSLNIKVCNGGITSTLCVRLVYEDMVKKGQTDSANRLIERILPKWQIANFKKDPSGDPKLEIAHKVLKATKEFGLDYINFHWYVPARGMKGEDYSNKLDQSVLDAIVGFLHNETGRPVVTNEVGQLAASPKIVSDILNKLYSLNLDFIVWYSGDGGEGKAIALQNANGTLRENGEAFRTTVKELLKKN